jgi:bifunctional non-homologous end joining protein LigD
MLREILPSAGPLRFSDHIEKDGVAMFEQVQQMRLEGVVAKKADSAYRAGRSPDWLKIRADRTDDFVVVGFTDRKGTKRSLGAIHVAQYRDDSLIYSGRVGTGFSDSQLGEVRAQLDELPQITDAGLLRHPSFIRFRDDKPPKDCVSEQFPTNEAEPVTVVDSPEEARVVSFTNLNKVFWPDEDYTKGDLLEYYGSIAEWLIPYLRDRPLVMTRYPDGIDGKSFFQKDAPKFAPDWIRRLKLWSEGSERELDYFVAENVESLLYIINLGTIPLHIWSSRVATLERPDWCILDLDPKDAPFKEVVRIAKTLRSLCDQIELPCFVKSSGSTGLHVLIPLGHQCTYEQSRTLGHLLARVTVAELPEIATIARVPSKREGKVYIDYLQNGHGRLLVSPFCVRPLAGAPVSVPLKWSELTTRLDISRHTIKTVPHRMKRLIEDPLTGILSLRPDLHQALRLLTDKFT